MAAFGIEARVPTSAGLEVFPVLPENFRAVEVFCACATQWRYAGMTGACVGLDYPAVESVMRMMAVDDPRDTFERLRLIEEGALAAMREKQA